MYYIRPPKWGLKATLLEVPHFYSFWPELATQCGAAGIARRVASLSERRAFAPLGLG